MRDEGGSDVGRPTCAGTLCCGWSADAGDAWLNKALQGGLIDPVEARRRVLDRVRPVAAERAALVEAHGRWLAEDVVSRDDHPPFPASTMDGYAVVAADASPWREVVGYQPAGAWIDAVVSDGAAVRIMTGAAIPAGADAVVRVENTELAEDHVVIHQTDVSVGENIRPVGSDLAKGAVVLRAGTRVGPVEVGLLATVGLAVVAVARRPRVAVISTGDELVEPGQPVAPGQIRDSNRFSVAAAIREAGGDVVFTGRASDEIADLRRIVDALPGDLDVLVTNGGVSVGDRDVVGALIGETAEVHFDRVLMKPGKPLTFATRGELLIFGLPGNPVSSMVALELFVRPALLAMQGATRPEREIVTVETTEELRRSDRVEYQRAVVSVSAEGRLTARSTGNQISSRLLSLAGANALVIVEPGEGVVPAGSQTPAYLIDVPRAEGA